MIEAIHTTIEGRARFKVEGLLGSDSFKRFLEQRLSLEKDILSASASTRTGNILVSYNSNNNHHTIAFLLEDILIEAQQGPAGSDVSGSSVLPLRLPCRSRPRRGSCPSRP